MAVIDKENMWVYDYVSPCYKAPTQRTIYMNSFYRIETHDLANVNNRTGRIVGGMSWMKIIIGG